MTKRRWVVLLLAMLVLVGALYAQGLTGNVNSQRHPNLAAAHRFLSQAYEKVDEAQAAHNYNLDGHGHKAKALIEQAGNEIRLAAEAADRHKLK